MEKPQGTGRWIRGSDEQLNPEANSQASAKIAGGAAMGFEVGQVEMEMYHSTERRRDERETREAHSRRQLITYSSHASITDKHLAWQERWKPEKID